MNVSMRINKTGIKSQQLALNAISHNIANVSTAGYKAKGVRFQALMNNQMTEADVLLNRVTPGVSAGVKSEVAVTDFKPGDLRSGTSALNLAVAGEGFFGVQNNAGDFFLTKDGTFTVDGSGRLVNGQGDFLVMSGALPMMTGGVETLTISGDGRLLIQANGVEMEAGQINLYRPANLETLQPAGSNYFVDPTNNLQVVNDTVIQTNQVELSNVDLAEELSNMIVAQRAYSLNVKVAQSTDEIMSLMNQLSM